MRTYYRVCRSCGDMHALHAWPHNCMPEAPARSDYPAPYIVSDYLPGGVNGMRNMLGGRDDSKSTYYRKVKRAGCEIVGNDSVIERMPTMERYAVAEADVAQDVKKSIEILTPMSGDERANMMRAIETPVGDISKIRIANV